MNTIDERHCGVPGCDLPYVGSGLCYRHRSRKNNYQLTTEEFLRLIVITHCEMCGRAGEGKLNIDHNHTTNKVRGMLCSRCNIGLGMLETEGWLEAALKYEKLHATP